MNGTYVFAEEIFGTEKKTEIFNYLKQERRDAETYLLGYVCSMTATKYTILNQANIFKQRGYHFT